MGFDIICQSGLIALNWVEWIMRSMCISKMCNGKIEKIDTCKENSKLLRCCLWWYTQTVFKIGFFTETITNIVTIPYHIYMIIVTTVVRSKDIGGRRFQAFYRGRSQGLYNFVNLATRQMLYCGKAVEMHIKWKVSMWKKSKSLEGFEVAEEMSNGPEVTKASILGAYSFFSSPCKYKSECCQVRWILC